MKNIFALSSVFGIVSGVFFWYVLPEMYSEGDRSSGILTALLMIVWYGLAGGLLTYFLSQKGGKILLISLPILYLFTSIITELLFEWTISHNTKSILDALKYGFLPSVFIVYIPAVIVSFFVKGLIVLK